MSQTGESDLSFRPLTQNSAQSHQRRFLEVGRKILTKQGCGSTLEAIYITSHMNFYKLSHALKVSSILAAACVLAAPYPVKAQEDRRQSVQSTPQILSVPCVDGGGSGGWMYEGLPDKYFPLGLITANQWPSRSTSDHPMYDPDASWNTYATCVIVPARQS